MYGFKDPIHEEAKQESLNFLNSQIINMLGYGGEEGVFEDHILNNLPVKDIHTYMLRLDKKQNLPFKLASVKWCDVRDPMIFEALCEYSNLFNIPFETLTKHRVYFIETSDFAVTVIPIKINKQSINVHIEPLDQCPGFVQEIYQNNGKLGMGDINFIKYDKKGNRIG